ncbi:Gfo/Idh/MocA family oxidoreductase [Kiritimatiellota bacterium B12222]|nr:Gfo/Idh/MocA family oxidoreductase [Kiritimatiellota bacterium B12222]
MKEVRVGIIGLGFMGTTHFDIYKNNPKARIVAIADINPVKQSGDISAVAGNLGEGGNSQLDFSDIRTYHSGLELIQDPDIDLVDICTPVTTHREFALAALATGKNVMVEKPFARTSQQAQDIADAAKSSPGKVLVGQCIRYWPEYRHAGELVKSGKAGKIRTASFKRVSPSIDGNGWENWFMKETLSGGALLDLHLHDVDYVREIFGCPRSLSAFGAMGVRSDTGIDHVFARFDYGNDALITLEGSWTPAKGTPFEMSFLIVGETLTIRMGAEGYQIIHEDGRIETPDISNDAGPTGWHVEIDHLLSCIQNDSDVGMDLDGVVESIRLIEAEEKSIRSNTPITLG